MTKADPYSQYDPMHLDAIEEILGRPNLCAVLEELTPLAFLTDPVFGMPWATGEDEHLGTDSAIRVLRQSMHLWHAAYFAMVALRRSNSHRRSSLASGQLTKLVNHYNSYDGPLPVPASDEDLLSQCMRMAYQQFPFQREWWAGMTRARFMFQECSDRKPHDLSGVVRAVFGASYDEVLGICADLYFFFLNAVKTGKRPIFTMRLLAQRFLPWVEEGTLARVVDAISQTQSEFRNICDNTAGSDPRLRKYDYNPLLARPLIQIGDIYFCPVPALLLLWTTDGINYVLSDYARTSGKDGAFFNTFGHAFEDFVEHLLRKSGREYIREVSVRRKEREDSADFILVEGDSALIFDCKTRRTTVKHRYGMLEAIDRDYEDIVSGLEQDTRTERWIREGIEEFAQHPRLRGVSQFHYGVVTLDHYYLANSSAMQRKVQQSLGRSIEYQVLSSRELELLASSVRVGGILAIIRDKSSDSYDLPASYEDYLKVRQGAAEGVRLVDPSQRLYVSLLKKLRDHVERLHNVGGPSNT